MEESKVNGTNGESQTVASLHALILKLENRVEELEAKVAKLEGRSPPRRKVPQADVTPPRKLDSSPVPARPRPATARPAPAARPQKEAFGGGVENIDNKKQKEMTALAQSKKDEAAQKIRMQVLERKEEEKKRKQKIKEEQAKKRELS